MLEQAPKILIQVNRCCWPDTIRYIFQDIETRPIFLWYEMFPIHCMVVSSWISGVAMSSPCLPYTSITGKGSPRTIGNKRTTTCCRPKLPVEDGTSWNIPSGTGSSLPKGWVAPLFVGQGGAGLFAPIIDAIYVPQSSTTNSTIEKFSPTNRPKKFRKCSSDKRVVLLCWSMILVSYSSTITTVLVQVAPSQLLSLGIVVWLRIQRKRNTRILNRFQTTLTLIVRDSVAMLCVDVTSARFATYKLSPRHEMGGRSGKQQLVTVEPEGKNTAIGVLSILDLWVLLVLVRASVEIGPTIDVTIA